MYNLYQSDVITHNYDDFLLECTRAKNIIQTKIAKDTTWSYSLYNLFMITSSSDLFYDLFKELNHFIRDYVGDDRKLWMQAWINFHKPHEVLDWHGHPWDFHGYISVDPKKSRTVFRQWQIDNKIGQVYIGPGSKDQSHEHKVEVLEPYQGDRITIGFDCTTELNRNFTNMIPII